MVAGLALLLRMAYVFQLSKTPFYYPDRLDPLFYFNWAREIAAGQWIGDKIFVQSPLYAYLVAVFLKLLGEGRLFQWGLHGFQVLAGVGTCLLMIRIARRVASEREAFFTGLLVACYGPFLFYEGMVMKTFLSTFLTVYLVDLLLRSEGTHRRKVIAAGFVFALTSLVRDNFVLLFPLLLAGFFLACPTLSLRQKLKACAFFTLGAALGILPVTARNYAVGKEFALLTTGGGEVFYIGNNADANGRYLPPPFVHATPEKEHDDFIAKAGELSGRKLTPGESSAFWLRQGLSWIGQNPGAWLKLLWRKTVIFWNAYELPDNYNYYEIRQLLLSPISLAGLLLFFPLRLFTFSLVAPLGLLGIVLSWRRWRALVWIYLVLFGYMGTVLLFFNFSRFRVPIVPFLCLFASTTLIAAWDELYRWIDHYAHRPTDGEAEISPSSLPQPWMLYQSRPYLAAVPVLGVILWLTVNLAGTGGRGVFPTVQSKLSLGDAYREQGRYAEAEKEYHLGLKILGDEPMDPGTAAALGVDPARMRQEVETERMAQGVNFGTVRAGLHFGLGATWMDHGKELLDTDRGRGEDLLRRGITQIEEAAKQIPYPPYLRRLAEGYSAIGDTAKAEKTYRAALLIAPDEFGLHYDLAGLFYETQRYSEALAELRSAKQPGKMLNRPELSDYHFGIGLVQLDGFQQQGQALYHFQEALEAYPQHREAKRIHELIAEISKRGVKPVPEP
jgi:tetratricopeptide (TPR) repeat protein